MQLQQQRQQLPENNETPTAFPSVDFTNDPESYDMDSALFSKFIKAKKLFLEHGAVLLKGVMDPEFVQSLHDQFMEEYNAYLDDKIYSDALDVGEKRNMVTVKVDGFFGSDRFFANSFVYQVVTSLLGSNMNINSVGGVVSLPGSTNQHIHSDNPPIFGPELFGKNDDEYLAWNAKLPPYCVAAHLPLVPINEQNGNTRVWLGSHKTIGVEKHTNFDEGGTDYEAELGDLVLVDFRTSHAGRENNSDHVRPLVYCEYARPWYLDAGNFTKQKPLLVTSAAMEAMNPKFKPLFQKGEVI